MRRLTSIVQVILLAFVIPALAASASPKETGRLAYQFPVAALQLATKAKDARSAAEAAGYVWTEYDDFEPCGLRQDCAVVRGVVFQKQTETEYHVLIVWVDEQEIVRGFSLWLHNARWADYAARQKAVDAYQRIQRRVIQQRITQYTMQGYEVRLSYDPNDSVMSEAMHVEVER